MRRASLRAVAVISTLVTSTSCGAAIRSGGTPPPGPDFGVRTFAWADVDQFVVGDARLRDSRLFEDVLHEAVEWELTLRGMRHDESSPDLLVHHHLALAGHAGDATGGGYTPDQGEEATVVVHIVDTASGEDVWIGWAQSSLEDALRSPEDLRSWVYRMVHRMLSDWEPPEFIEGITAQLLTAE